MITLTNAIGEGFVTPVDLAMRRLKEDGMRGHQQYVQQLQRAQQQQWQQQFQRQMQQRQQQERAAAYRAARRAQQHATAAFGVESEGPAYQESSGNDGRWLFVLLGSLLVAGLLLGL